MTPAFGVEGRGGRGLIVRKIGAGTRPGRGHRGHGKSREAMCAQGCTIGKRTGGRVIRAAPGQGTGFTHG